ncbi:hypothetical protein [Rhizobium leguminosarum]|uniref:hypothetical protein n=1 Tax=Rhizobium leguminosarum TaxID=384 RepID=UPI001442140D|nr:hypothetical protein [Rhizobium leguminosarum]NKJ77817.1 hypothetical protein [Rhizobium leguminosarum bv. viciae]
MVFDEASMRYRRCDSISDPEMKPPEDWLVRKPRKAEVLITEVQVDWAAATTPAFNSIGLVNDEGRDATWAFPDDHKRMGISKGRLAVISKPGRWKGRNVGIGSIEVAVVGPDKPRL